MADPIARGKFAAPVAQEGVAADWRERGYSCRLFVDPPGQRWMDFVHDVNELVTVLEGALDMRVGTLHARLLPGDEVFIPKGASHDVINAHDGTTRWLFGYD